MSESAIEALGLISLETTLTDQPKVVEFLEKSQLDSQDTAISGAFLHDLMLITKALINQESPSLSTSIQGMRIGYVRKVSDSEEMSLPYRVESCFLEDSDWQINIEAVSFDSSSSLLGNEERVVLDNSFSWLSDGFLALYPDLNNCLEMRIQLQLKLRFFEKFSGSGRLERLPEDSSSETFSTSTSSRKIEVFSAADCWCNKKRNRHIGSDGICHQGCP